MSVLQNNNPARRWCPALELFPTLVSDEAQQFTSAKIKVYKNFQKDSGVIKVFIIQMHKTSCLGKVGPKALASRSSATSFSQRAANVDTGSPVTLLFEKWRYPRPGCNNYFFISSFFNEPFRPNTFYFMILIEIYAITFTSFYNFFAHIFLHQSIKKRYACCNIIFYTNR